MDKNRVREFIEGIKRRGLKIIWSANIRADYFNDGFVNAAMLAELKNSGCFQLNVGAESGSQRILDKLKKDIKVENLLTAAQLLRNTGIITMFSFLTGIPGETPAEIRQTTELILRLQEINPDLIIIGPQIFRPYPGGELYDECVESFGYRPPATFAQWRERMGTLTGFENLDKLTWIKDSNLVENVAFYFVLASQTPQRYKISAVKKTVLRLFSAMARWRLRHFCFALPLDMAVLKFYKNTSHKP